MIVNLWSTPRTGSNWYAQYLQKNLDAILFHQFINYYHLINYQKSGYNDFVYEYDLKCSYLQYSFDKKKERIIINRKAEKRKLSADDEENHRLGLLDNHDFTKYPSIFYNHIAPVSHKAYSKLFAMADRNIFLYRKDIKRQLSSYALGYGTKEYKFTGINKIHDNINVSFDVLKNLADRIQFWHDIDKASCEIVCYEDLDFDMFSNLPKKQNQIDPFLQLDKSTQDSVLELTTKIKPSL